MTPAKKGASLTRPPTGRVVMPTTPESGEEPTGEVELAADLAALDVDVNKNGDAGREEESSAAAEEPADAIDGWIPPPREECPVCFLPLPLKQSLLTYMACCGKTICCGCHDDMKRACQAMGRADIPCPFCRTPASRSNEEVIARLEERTEKNDAHAMFVLGDLHIRGYCRLPEGGRKGMDLVRRAADLGLPSANCFLGLHYVHGKYVERDLEESSRLFKIAADKGDYIARCELGRLEEALGNVSAAMKHYKISASAGNQGAVDALQGGYKNGHISKGEFAASLRAFQAAKDEMASESREREARSRAKGQKGGR